MPIVKCATTKEEHAYHAAPDFVSAITIGGSAPDGKVLTLDGTATTLHEMVDDGKLTVLNFGSCT